jgi:hypothetical protein
MKKQFLTIGLGLALALSFAGPALAQTSDPGFGCTGPGGTNCKYVPLEPLSLLDESGTTSFAGFISSLFKVLFAVSGLLAVVMLTFGGIEYMVSDIAHRKNEGLARAQAAVYGILILAGSWLLLHTINPELLNFNLDIPGSSAPAQQAQTSTTGSSGGSSDTSGGTGSNSVTDEGGAKDDADVVYTWWPQADRISRMQKYSKNYCGGKLVETSEIKTDKNGQYYRMTCKK